MVSLNLNNNKSSWNTKQVIFSSGWVQAYYWIFMVSILIITCLQVYLSVILFSGFVVKKVASLFLVLLLTLQRSKFVLLILSPDVLVHINDNYYTGTLVIFITALQALDIFVPCFLVFPFLKYQLFEITIQSGIHVLYCVLCTGFLVV